MNYSIYNYLDIRSTTKEGLHPVKIAISYNRRVDYINTAVYSTAEEWPSLNGQRPPRHLQQKRAEIEKVADMVRGYAQRLTKYDIKTLRKLVKGAVNATKISMIAPSPKSTNVWDWYDIKISELREQSALGSVEAYECSKAFYQKYSSIHPLDFAYFDKANLYRIEREYITATGNSKTVVHKHARHLRAIFNIAIEEKVIDRSIYPFNKRGYKIIKSRKTKKALNSTDLDILLTCTPICQQEQCALDYFIFSFYGNGMNMKDIAFLSHDNINKGFIEFYRKKTENTSSDPVLIKVYITPEMQEIIRRQGTPKEGLLFPLINANDPAEKQRKDYKNHNRLVNTWLKKLVKRLDISINVTHGMSRHTFSNALKQAGVQTAFIREALGHSSEAVTDHYLSSFEDDTIKAHSDLVRNYSKSVKPKLGPE